MVERFLTVHDFFEIGDSPDTKLKSSALGIHTVSNLAGRFETKDVFEIEKKCVLLPYRQCFVAVPLSTNSG